MSGESRDLTDRCEKSLPYCKVLRQQYLQPQSLDKVTDHSSLNYLVAATISIDLMSSFPRFHGQIPSL